MIFSARAYPQESEDKFKQGVNYFASGDFDKALEVWTDLYMTGYRSASLITILEMHILKLIISRAILFYERAHLLNPADEDINYNLQIARTLIVDRFQEIPELFFVRWYNFLSLSLSTNIWAKISLVSFILCLLFFHSISIHQNTS